MGDTAADGTPDIERLAIDTIRCLAMDAVQKADSGHPGTPMALAPIAHLLWTRHLRYDPADPTWPGRDRFILSAGHASMLLYSMLYLTGHGLELEDLKQFRQWESRTPGHPEYGMTPGVETTTGPLGQGFGNGVGMAIAERWLAAHFNRPGHEMVDHHVYAIVSDGDLMEGVSHETASLAGHLGLGKLIYLYDDNRITIDGTTDLSFSEDVAARFAAYGWHVQRVADGNDLERLEVALRSARRETNRPSLIVVRTHIAYGSPNKQDTPDAHGAPLGDAEIRLTKQAYGFPATEPFHVPAEVLDFYRTAAGRGGSLRADWQKRFQAYAAEHPDLAREWQRLMAGELAAGWDSDLPELNGDMATRDASGKIMQALGKVVPELIGGSADLAASCKTYIKDGGDFQAASPAGRNFHFGIREHGMGSVLNGMALHGGVRPYGSTFLIFSDYMRPPIRLAALMEQPVIFVFTHDSVGLGEDGPTHQPIEQIPALRAIPGLVDLRPADAAETVAAWRVALEHRHGPVFMALTRQKVPAIDRARHGAASGLARGAYILADAEGGEPEVILIASGSEVQLILGAHETLAAEGIRARAVSMPSWALFREQPREYRDEVLPPAVTARVAVEAAGTLGWHEWVGAAGTVIGLLRFGASAPATRVFQELGFTADNVAAAARRLLGRPAGREDTSRTGAGPTRYGHDEH
jgi:transketolase